MKVANFLLSGLAVVAMGFMGCNENSPVDPGGQAGAPSAPRNIQATSVSASSVALKWDAPNGAADTGTITYSVSWAPTVGGVAADSGFATVASTSHTVSGLATNKAYVFYVRSVRSAKSSGASTITWAGAMRYAAEPGGSVTIKMYETQSVNGSGLTLDPPTGPKNVSVGTSNNVPNSVQLAIYTTNSSNNEFEIGPAYAFTEYKNADKFDRNTFVSDSSFPATSLSTWYSTGSIATRIPSNGNVRAFTLPVAQANNGQGFYVRTGATQATYHYARVFIKNVGGKLLQGTAPNRFVELEISYQQNADLPYAKTASGASVAPTPGNVASKVYHQ